MAEPSRKKQKLDDVVGMLTNDYNDGCQELLDAVVGYLNRKTDPLALEEEGGNLADVSPRDMVPLEMWLIILSYLGQSDVVSFSATCRKYNKFCKAGLNLVVFLKWEMVYVVRGA